jgi:predicted methyltransferase
MNRFTSFLALTCVALTCGAGGAYAAAIPANIASAVADSARPDADKQRDADRKPGETLAFAGIKNGEQVAELLPGSGYFTRILSKAVGTQGKVFAVVPPRPANAPPDRPDPAARLQPIIDDQNYSNVSVLQQPLATLSVPTPVDLVFTAQNYHDLHNVPTLDIAAFNKSVFDSLKPGGLYVIVDHSAQAGSEVRDTSTLHRIDEATAKKEVMAAGFEFVGSSNVLANAADPRTAKVFDPSIRGKTDQFILKFRKPKK